MTCVGNLLGWSSGASGFVAHTTDGGQTWAEQASGLTADLRTIRFGTSGLGLVGGDAGALAITANGGTTWAQVATGTQSTIRGVAVSSTGVLLAVGDGGFGLRSTDGGANWSSLKIAGAGDLTAVAMDANAKTAIVADTLGHVYWTVNAGASFYLETTAAQPIRALSIADDGVRALAVGDLGTVLERQGSDAWTTVDAGTSTDLHAALILDGDVSEYIGGEAGMLMQTMDHGSHWASVPVATTASINGLDDL